MPTLDYITIRGFKSIKAIEHLDLRPINLIIGPNGSGKSNFIGAFAFLHAVRDGRLQEYVARAGGSERILHFGSKVTQSVFCELSFNKQEYRYRVAFEPTDDDRLIPSPNTETFGFPLGQVPFPPDAQLIGKHDLNEALISRKDNMIVLPLSHLLSSVKIYHFHDTSTSSPMKKTADVNDNRFLRPDGANLAAFLYLLKVKHETEYSLIRRTFQRVAPFFDDFLLEPLALNPETIRLEWKHRQSDAYFDASALSDGSLRFLALAMLLLQPVDLRPSLILIDEPELGLHPYAITLLASLIKQASAQTQVIVSTQSAGLLDHFEPEDVLVANLVDGATQLTRLSSKGLEAWLEDYSLGQLWEKNEIGGRPGGGGG